MPGRSCNDSRKSMSFINLRPLCSLRYMFPLETPASKKDAGSIRNHNVATPVSLGGILQLVKLLQEISAMR